MIPVSLERIDAPALDPLLYGFPFSLQESFHPLGFEVQIASNDARVLEGARRSWGGFERLHAAEPLRYQVAVAEKDIGDFPRPPVFRAQGNLLAFVSDAGNFAVSDLSRGFAFCWLTPQVASAETWMRVRFLESIVYATLTHLYLTPVHAACVARNGRGVLLSAPAGTGKSCLALACARRGWTYLSDDATYLLELGDRPLALGKPKQIRFRESAAELFGELSRYPALPDASGAPAIEVDTAGLDGLATAQSCHLDSLVFLNRCDRRDARLVAVDPGDAYRRLVSDLPMYEPAVHQRHRAALEALARGRTCELQYGSLDGAVDALDGLIAEAR